MTTVEQLIEQLSKMPKDLPVVVNVKEHKYEIGFCKIEIEQKDFDTTYSDPGTKQKFVILNQRRS